MRVSLAFGLFCSAKLQRTEAAVEQYRSQIDRNKAEKFGFASMAAVPYAHIVANMLRRKRVKGTTITLAPNPKDIVSHHCSCILYCALLTYLRALDLG